MTPRRVSIKDVAREAGVSVTTVSHALNDKGRLSESTRRHVREVAARLGYRPNPAARSLVSGKTRLIAAMASLPDDPRVEFTEFGYYTALIGAASGAAVARDHALVVAPPTRSGFIWERVPLDGVIVIDPVIGETALPALRAAGIPYVTIGDDADGGGGPAVSADETAGTFAMLDHFVERGAERVGLLAIPPVNAFARTTIDAYGAWCSRAGQVPERVVMELDDLVGDDDGSYLAASLDRLLGSGVDAVYAPIEIIGIAAQRLIRSRGLDVPRDVMIATTLDGGRALHADPPLTTLTFDYPEMGRQAADLLLDLIAGARPSSTALRVPATVTPRASTERA